MKILSIKILVLSISLRNIVSSVHVVEFKDDNYPRRSDLVTANDYEQANSGDEISDDDEHHEIVSMLEERYKFINDNTSTRYKIASDERYPGKGSLILRVWCGSDEPEEKRAELSAKPSGHLFRKLDEFCRNINFFMVQLILVMMSVVFPKSTSDKKLAWAFRTYAVRRIVGGMETSISMYPYNVAISRNGKHWCGGSIIDEQWVLTAGHCFESAHDGDNKKLLQFIVRAGSSFHNRGGYQARVNKVFFPKKYAPGSADYDFSLLRLDRPMPIGRNIAVLNLPAQDYEVQRDDLLIVTGWGSTHETGLDNIPDRLRFVPVPIMRLEECQSAYRFYITPRMMCAGYATGGKDACNHDSGGPAVRDGVLIGIVSFGGKKCGDARSPGVYSRVTEITEWVESTVTGNEACDVPELKAKIEKARLREKELQKFKARVEEKRNKIKDWLRETLKSPTFLKLAKKKLTEAGVLVSKNFRRTHQAEYIDDKTLDEINLSHLISERILEDTERNEPEVLLRSLAMQEVVMNESNELNRKDSGEVEAIVAYLT